MAWFLDLGANWANTLTLYTALRTPARPLWNIVAFEASPLVQPFLRDYCAFLNGERDEEPENCLPRSGSTEHLLRYAPKYGCPTSAHMGRICMWKCLESHLNALVPDPTLNSSDYVDRALQNALLPPLNGRDRYTVVPAAVGNAKGWTTVYETPQQLIRGGALSNTRLEMQPKRVNTVDVAEWLLHLPADAYVFLKMDIEGAEHDLVRRMEQLGSHRRVHILSIECHGKKCRRTMERIKSWNVTIMTEKEHHGMDDLARSHLTNPVVPRCRCERATAGIKTIKHTLARDPAI